jgi:hypothetical protein
MGELDDDAAKPDFSTTPEPRAGGNGGRQSGCRSVIQEHAASSLHDDVRLEVGGRTLQRTPGATKPQWLLINRRDEGADARRNPVDTQRESVLSGRTVDDIGD